jgi:hypothetical protein
VQASVSVHAWAVSSCHTVDIYLLLSHELPKALQAGGCVDLLHVDWSLEGWRCGECPDGRARRVCDCAGKGPEHGSGYDGMEARYMLADVGFMQAFGYSSFKLKG